MYSPANCTGVDRSAQFFPTDSRTWKSDRNKIVLFVIVLVEVTQLITKYAQKSAAVDKVTDERKMI